MAFALAFWTTVSSMLLRFNPRASSDFEATSSVALLVEAALGGRSIVLTGATDRLLGPMESNVSAAS